MIRDDNEQMPILLLLYKTLQTRVAICLQSSISSRPPIDLGGIKIRLNDFDSLAGLIVIL